MHKNLLLLFALIISTGLSAQFVLINSPQDCAGALNFSPTTGFGADLNSDVWTADVVIADDGTAAPTEGCSPFVNGADIMGKIAIIDRGSCNFSLKALNAQNVGAIAAVIANNIPGGGTVLMAAGTFGADVTIPVVMISYEDGQIIKNKIESNIAVNMSIGNIKFPNDIGALLGNIIFPKSSTIPAHQVKSADDFIFVSGARVYNAGLNAGENVILEGTINFTDGGGTTEVFNELGTVATIDVDSSKLIVLGDYDPSSNGSGRYDVSYSISSDSSDDADFDNTFNSSFHVTDNVYARARWNEANNTPNRTTGFTIQDGGPIEMITPFEFPNGKGITIDSVLFSVSSQGTSSLANVELNVILYKWDDADDDGNVTAAEIEIVGFAPFTFGPGETATTSWVTVVIEDFATGDFGYKILEDDARFFVGTQYRGGDLIFFGFDQSTDLFEYINNVATPNATYNDAQLPYLVSTDFGAFGSDFDAVNLFTNLWACSATALYVNGDTDANRDLTDEEATISIYPNPVAEVLTVEVELSKLNNSKLEYKIIDMQGRIIFVSKTNQISRDVQKFDVSQLSSGSYELIITADQGSKGMPFVVK